MTDLETTRQRPGGNVPPVLATAAAWSWRLTAVAAFVALVAIVAYQLRVVTVPIFLAVLATTVLSPPVHFLRRKGFRPALATGTVFVAVLVVLGSLGYLLAAPVSNEFADLGPQVTKAVDDVNDWLANGPLSLDEGQLARYQDTLFQQLQSNSATLRTGVVTSATLAIEIVTGLILAIVLTFFFVKDGDKITKAISQRLPERRRQLITAASDRAFHTLGGYLRGVAATGVVDALFIGIALYLIGVPLLLPLVVLTFFGAFFPVVGATLAGFVAAAVALVNGGFGDALLVIVAVLIVQQIEGNVLQPFLVGRAVSLHPAVIVVALTTGAIVAGILGAFLAVPLTAVAGAVWREIEQQRQLRLPGSESAG